MPLFCLAAMVCKNTPGNSAWCLLNGYRIAATEDEARGNYLRSVNAEKPGYALVDMLCMEVPEGAIRAGMAVCT